MSKTTRCLQMINELSLPATKSKTDTEGVEDVAEVCVHSEALSWLDVHVGVPLWSRINQRNAAGRYRNLPMTKFRKYDIEIDKRLWSLWGTLHPHAPVFHCKSRGKQYLACNVMACCAALVHPLADWNSQLLDSIVINGDKYHRESMANIKRRDYEFSLEDLNLRCCLETLRFSVHLEHKLYGKLFCNPTKKRMNLGEALTDFFSQNRLGVLQCQRRSLAIGFVKGPDGGYFMFDCQSKEQPLFPKGQGAAYILLTKQLQVLHYCIVATLNIPYYHMQFNIHEVEVELISDPKLKISKMK